jgi:cyclophilin family peptidyl-prolyl cis-trans isomerase
MKTAIAAALCALFSGALPAADAAAPAGSTATQPKDQTTMSATANPTVQMTTSLGEITIELFADKAPVSVSNFLAYVDANFYDGTIFHRVIPNFMIQGGGFTADMRQKPTKPTIRNEADNGLKNTRGTLAMARTAVVDSATSQFFVNTVDNGFLDFRDKSAQGYGYAVFGQVTAGMDVVDKITQVRTGNRGPHQNVPAEPVTILKVTRGVSAAK